MKIPAGKRHLEELDLGKWVSLSRFLKRCHVKIWTVLISMRVRISAEL
jgi:hypothetical protein